MYYKIISSIFFSRLHQDIACFNDVSAGKVATQIQTDTHESMIYFCCEQYTFNNVADLVQQGISEKVALIISYLASCITGFALGCICSWHLALVVVMNKFLCSYIVNVILAILIKYFSPSLSFKAIF